jgi:hypothetical protein
LVSKINNENLFKTLINLDVAQSRKFRKHRPNLKLRPLFKTENKINRIKKKLPLSLTVILNSGDAQLTVFCLTYFIPTKSFS